MRPYLFVLSFVLPSFACSSEGNSTTVETEPTTPDNDCRCAGAVPEGHLDVSCGESQCVGGTGYQCTGPNAAQLDPDACAEPTSDAGTEPTCDCGVGERCVSGACTAGPWLSVSVTENASQLENGSVDWVSGSAMACAYWPTGHSGRCPEELREGDCWVPSNDCAAESAWETRVADWGEVNVRGGVRASLDLVRNPSQSHPCASGTGDDPYADLFHAGDELTISSSGSAAVPSFSESLTAPADLRISTSHIVRGQPLELRWTSNGENKILFFVSTGARSRILCNVADTGSYTIAGSLTALLEPNPAGTIGTEGFIRGDRIVRRHLEPEGVDVAVDLSVASGVTRNVTLD